MERLKTILFVDDNRDNLDLIVRMLKKENYNIIPVRWASDALEILNKSTIDLLVLDISLPEISGIDLLKLIHAQDKWKNIPAIALSANPVYTYGSLCINAGFKLYLSKPITRAELLNGVNRTLKETTSNSEKLAYSSQ